MEEEISIDTNSEIPTTHFFVYNKKPYPFNYDLFKIFSQHFDSNQPPEEKNIKLLDESIKISEASIPDFINFCQARKIVLTKENAPSLYQLSLKLKVPTLFNKTKNYILNHQKEVVVEMIIMYREDPDFKLSEYEEIISNDLVNYVHDDRLLELPIPNLYRIVNKYLIKYQDQNESPNSAQPPELIEFLFKCLDHYGQNASVLFDHVNLLGSGGSTINRLFDGYSEKFDFHFVSTGCAMSIYQLEGQIIARQKAMKQAISQSQNEILSVSQQVKEEIESLRKQHEEEMKKRDQMLESIQPIVVQEIEKMRRQHDQEMNEKNQLIINMQKKHDEELKKRDKIIDSIPQIVVQECEKMKRQHDEQMNEKNMLIEKLVTKMEEMMTMNKNELGRQQQEFKETMRLVNDKLDKLRNNRISRVFNSESDPSGLIAFFGDKVNISAGGDSHSNCPLSNIRKYNNDLFCNWYNNKPSSESVSFIMFDFGQSKKIDMHSYFIRSNSSSPSSSYHPKTWRIEGSNDGSSWTKLDRRANDANLNGEYKQCHFVCQFGSYGSESNCFRYIKYVQEDSWYSGCKYAVYITYFELYGDVITV